MKHAHFDNLLKRYLHDDCIQSEAWMVDQWCEARDMPRLGPAATKAGVWQQIRVRTQPVQAAWCTSRFRWAAAGPESGWALSPRRLVRLPVVTPIFQFSNVGG